MLNRVRMIHGLSTNAHVRFNGLHQELAFPMAGAMSALRALSGYRAERCKCLLLTANQAFK